MTCSSDEIGSITGTWILEKQPRYVIVSKAVPNKKNKRWKNVGRE